MSKEENIQSFKIAATFLGTIVGAGFATGQEIMKFFTVYRFDGFIGIVISTMLFIVLGIIIFSISHKIKRKTYHDFLLYICGTKFGVVVDVLVTVFLFGVFNVMISAAGALFFEHFGFSYYVGIIFTLIFAIIIVIKGMKGILNVNFIVAPIMITIMLLISFMSLYYFGSGDLIRNLHYEDDITYKWLMSALLYVSYNIILATPILVPITKEIKNKKVLFKGVALGAAIMGMLVLLLNTVILNQMDKCSSHQIPMLYIVEPFSDLIKYLFVLILWLEIFTTSIGNLFGLVNRLHSVIRINFKKITIIIGIVSLFISRFDFKTLLHIFYPTFGFVSLLFILFLPIRQIYLKLKYISKNKA